MRAVLVHQGELQLHKKDSGTNNYTLQADANSIFVSKSYNWLHFILLQILVCALMTANLWLKAQAQVLPVPVVTIPALPQQNVVTTVGAGIPIFPGVAAGPTGVIGINQNFGVSIY
jgi:hypothetical protein